MLDFEYVNSTKLIFGKGRHEDVGELIKTQATKVLLHYGGGSIKRNGIYEAVKQSLDNHSIPFIELGGVEPNPKLNLVYQGIQYCRNEGVNFILAVGGGSVIDSAKAIAAGMYYEGDVWELFEQRTAIHSALPIASILTLPATGSESNPSCVISSEEKKMKLIYGDYHLAPVFAIINPELFFTLPQHQLTEHSIC